MLLEKSKTKSINREVEALYYFLEDQKRNNRISRAVVCMYFNIKLAVDPRDAWETENIINDHFMI